MFMFSLRRWLRSAVLPLATVLAAGFICVTITIPAPAGALSEVILFSQPLSMRRYAIFAMRPDGNELRQIANMPTSCREPDLCAANNTVLFSALIDKHWHILSLNLTTSELRHMAGGRSDARHPSWLPDGKYFVFESDRWGQSELAIHDVENDQTQRLTYNQGINRHPSVSPDGTKVAYTSWIGGTPYIYMLNLNSQQVQDPTAWNVMWKPDLLVHSRNQITRGYHATLMPCWGGNNDTLIFEEHDYANSFVGTNKNDNELKDVLHKNSINARSVACSPDGKQVLFFTQKKKQYQLRLMDLSTGEISDFPRQFTKPLYDLKWQRKSLPWSLDELTDSDIQRVLYPPTDPELPAVPYVPTDSSATTSAG